MSKIQRYHTNEYGDLVKSNASYAKICKYEDVKHLERQLAEAREDVKKAVKQNFDALCDGVSCSFTFDEYWARCEFNKLKEEGDE